MDKHKFCLIAIGIIAILQGVAWVLNKNGTVFALTSGVIGAIIGYAVKTKNDEAKTNNKPLEE